MLAKNRFVKISRVLHAGYVLQSGDYCIAFDPIFENPFSRNCYAFPAVRFDEEKIRQLKFDAVFISHFHDDHFSLESLNLLDRSTTIYMYAIYEELFDMIRELGFSKVCSLSLDKSVIIGDFEVTPKKALDEDVDSLFHIMVAGLNILNVVDSWIGYDTLEELAKVDKWDLILWPFQTMRELEVLSPLRASMASRELPPEWIEQLKILKPHYLVPSSCQFRLEEWSWYNKKFFPISYEQFQKEINASLPKTQVLRLNPSVSVNVSAETVSPSDPLSWVVPEGIQDVDYEYIEEYPAMSTSEVATHFRALSAEQMDRVERYCSSEILERYQELGPTCDEFFDKTGYWCLSVFDHQGLEKIYYYEIMPESLTLLSERPKVLSWSTEVPAAKLYAALEMGESLTSMYLRVNGMTFAPEIEEDLKRVDVTEDPLIRCLFNGAVGAYQRAQLCAIKSRLKY